MKVRLNKATMGQMPDAVRAIVGEWKARFRRAFISVENTGSFFPSEDARVTLLNLTTGATGSAQAAGDFAGWTKLSPGTAIPLPVGIVAVEEGFFCGTPFLTVWQGSAPQVGGAR